MAVAKAQSRKKRKTAKSEKYWFDEKAAQKAEEFFPKYLRFTSGEWAGRPFELEGWQKEDIVRPVFGWKRQDGTRRYRRVFVWVPRKNGKTELAGGVSILMLVGDAEMGGEVYSMAADEDQAKIVFNKACMMVNWSPELSEILDTFKTSIWCANLSAAFKPLSGTPTGKHGLNMSGLIGDEIHEWRDDRLYTFVHQSSASRRQPLEILISTAGERSGYGWEMWNYCLKVLSGEVDDPETLVVMYAADPDDDWTDPETWRKANPNYGVSVKPEYLAKECERAKALPRLENDFKRYHLNIFTEQAVRWIPIDKWDACGTPSGKVRYKTAKSRGGSKRKLAREVVNDRWKDLPARFAGRSATCGIDLSSTTDLTCIVWTFPPESEGGVWGVVPRFFIPEDRIEERVKSDGVPYDRWVKEGALIAIPGNVIDQAYVKRTLFSDAESFKCTAVAIDRFLATQLAIEVQDENLNAVLFGQGFLSMSGPSKELEKLILSRRIDHGGHPVLRWCIGNTAIESDASENIKPSKKKSTERIDGTVGTVMGIGVALQGGEPEEDIDEFLNAPVIYS